MKKRKEEILHSKEQSTEQQPVQSSVQSSVQQPVQPALQSTVRSNDTYVYGVGMLAVLSIGVCVIFACNTFQTKKIINEKQDQPPKRLHIFKKPM